MQAAKPVVPVMAVGTYRPTKTTAASVAPAVFLTRLPTACSVNANAETTPHALAERFVIWIRADVSVRTAKLHAKTIVRATRYGAGMNVSSVHRPHRELACLVIHPQGLAVESCLSAVAVADAARARTTASRPLTAARMKSLTNSAVPKRVARSAATNAVKRPTAPADVSGCYRLAGVIDGPAANVQSLSISEQCSQYRSSHESLPSRRIALACSRPTARISDCSPRNEVSRPGRRAQARQCCRSAPSVARR